MKVNFVDLQRQNQALRDSIMPLIEKVILEADFNMGPRLEKFERDFAKFVGKKYAVGLNSGTDALLLSLIAYGIMPGDEVITAPNSYFSSAMVISKLGAVPKFVDINSDYFTIDVNKIEKAITKKTKAIIPVHIYGQPAEMDSILKLAKKYKLFVIEDACQAHGAKYKGKFVPIGETGAFSFYPGKNLGGFGDGGAVVTDSLSIANKLFHLRNDGAWKKYHHKMFGAKSRLDTIQAVILNHKLPNLNKWNNQRKKHAKTYYKFLSDVPQIKLPMVMEGADHVFHLFVIEAKKRNKLQKFLFEKGIDTVIHYPLPIHLQKPYRLAGYKKGDFPITEEKSGTIISLPMFPEITLEEISYVAETIREFYAKN
jgi:dTDP-4-amino-4,6-dideoxygalactose transaminase